MRMRVITFNKEDLLKEINEYYDIHHKTPSLLMNKDTSDIIDKYMFLDDGHLEFDAVKNKVLIDKTLDFGEILLVQS